MVGVLAAGGALALGAYGTAVLTALTAQNTRGVTGVHAVPAEFVGEQLRTLLDDHISGAANNTRELRSLIAIDHWLP